MAIQFGVGDWKLPFPDVAFHLTLPWSIVAPRKSDLFPTSGGCKLPLRFGGQARPPPCRISHGVLQRDVHHRMIQHLLTR